MNKKNNIIYTYRIPLIISGFLFCSYNSSAVSLYGSYTSEPGLNGITVISGHVSTVFNDSAPENSHFVVSKAINKDRDYYEHIWAGQSLYSDAKNNIVEVGEGVLLGKGIHDASKIYGARIKGITHENSAFNILNNKVIIDGAILYTLKEGVIAGGFAEEIDQTGKLYDKVIKGNSVHILNGSFKVGIPNANLGQCLDVFGGFSYGSSTISNTVNIDNGNFQIQHVELSAT